MRYAVAQNFKQGGRPEWLALKYRSGIPLNDTGALRQSIDGACRINDTALVGTNMGLRCSSTNLALGGA